MPVPFGRISRTGFPSGRQTAQGPDVPRPHQQVCRASSGNDSVQSCPETVEIFGHSWWRLLNHPSIKTDGPLNSAKTQGKKEGLPMGQTGRPSKTNATRGWRRLKGKGTDSVWRQRAAVQASPSFLRGGRIWPVLLGLAMGDVPAGECGRQCGMTASGISHLTAVSGESWGDGCRSPAAPHAYAKRLFRGNFRHSSLS